MLRRQRRERLCGVVRLYESEPGRRTAANLMTKDEARRIAANIARLPELLGAEPKPDANALFHRR